MTTGSLPCPGCGTPLATAPGTARCPACRLPLLGPDAAALWQVTVALNALDAQRHGLIVRRDQLLAALRARQDLPVPPPVQAPAGPNWAAPGTPWGLPPAPAKEVSGPSAQTVLLVLGGLMVAIAALVFTVVSWGSLGIGGRAAVLAAVTLCALLVPLPLRRRGLTATAETFAVLGLALVLLDWLAARAVGLAGLDRVPAASYWAAATALTALGAAVYGTALSLRGPRAVALALAQLPLSLAALAIDTDIGGYATAFLLTALLDLLAATRLAPRSAAPTPTPATTPTSTSTSATGSAHALIACGTGFTLLGALTSATQLFTATTLTEAQLAWPALVLLAALGLAVSTGRPASLLPLPVGHELRCAAAVLAGAAPLAGIGTGLRFALPAAWVPAGYAVPGALLLLGTLHVLTSSTPAPAEATAPATPAAPTAPPALPTPATAWAPPTGTAPTTPSAPPTPLGLFIAGAGAVLLAQLAALPALALAFFGPMERWALAWDWAGTTTTTAELHTTNWSLPLAPAVLFGLFTALLAIAAARCTRTCRPVPGRALLRAALVTGSVLACLLPALLGLPLTVGAFWALLLAGATAAVLAQQRPADPAPYLLALLPAATAAVVWGGTDRTATLVVWSVLTVAAALLAVRLPRRWAPPFGVFAVAALAVTALAAGRTGGLAPYELAFLLLAVTALTIPAAAHLARQAREAHAPAAPALAPAGGARTALATAVEWTGYVVALPAFALTAGHPGALSLALAVGGVLALAAALRPDRRPVALVGTGLLVLSSWVRLALAGVTVPEPYTLSVAAAALTIGHLRRRRSPELSSTAAYGAGLGLALLPSLVAVWADPNWLRPLLLGAAALALTVLGARQRLRAPLLYGAVTLTAVAVHELTPFVTQLVGALPRWVPLAAAGLLLLVLGATYERRLRDARRVRDGLRRFR
ncbi:SCO7613 C-terminal domain-containing membrane protein [Kitasatospora sp. NPDC051853]|uniref:SCO7613 C-terminal domain-containing membrane protein n=1 Tax=Kitasatospora sp. NPDC051853 TaxID=3364058 RepID=UPI0037AEB30C